MELQKKKKKLNCTINIKAISQAINRHNIIKFQALSDSHIIFPYLVRATLVFVIMSTSENIRIIARTPLLNSLRNLSYKLLFPTRLIIQ